MIITSVLLTAAAEASQKLPAYIPPIMLAVGLWFILNPRSAARSNIRLMNSDRAESFSVLLRYRLSGVILLVMAAIIFFDIRFPT